ncbi:50S ribosomal protein L9 [Candidatus Magnetoovum chiemensis]|nr:50S ribosomal protein L9 [Candidatus Magnetoovum chiemensis]
MKVILKEDIDNLGDMGAIVNVANGYARNYLIPKNLAVEANPRNIKVLEHEKRIIQEKIKKFKATATDIAQKLSSLELSFSAKAGEEGKLFGSVTSKDIADLLKEKGHEIDKKKIVLENPIKRIGEHSVKIKIHPEISAEIKIQVTAEAAS